MSAFRPRSVLKVARNVNQAVRGYANGGSGSGGSKYRLPALFGSAVLAGSAFVAMKSNDVREFSLIPQVHASPPKSLPTAEPMERTFIMIKPDGVKRGLIADIIKRFEQRGYKLVALKMLQADDALLNEHYADLKKKPFFPGLIKHITSGPVVAMVWEGKNAVKQGRQMLGETDPLKSKPGSIRGDFSIDMGRNIIHGSDSVESANAEIALWFTEGEIMGYGLPVHSQVFE
jgi:nucleoside-diphosphate kinase